MDLDEMMQKIKKRGIALGFTVYIPINNGDRPTSNEWGYWNIRRKVCNCPDDSGLHDSGCNMIGQNFDWELGDLDFQTILKVLLPKFRKNLVANKLRFQILKRDNFRCQYCGRGAKEGATLEIDHKIPRSEGGTSKEDNLITSCKECNRGKGTSSEASPALF